jgi:hypothetical protein
MHAGMDQGLSALASDGVGDDRMLAFDVSVLVVANRRVDFQL